MVGNIEINELGWAFLDIYLGVESKTPEVKKQFADGLINYLKNVCTK